MSHGPWPLGVCRLERRVGSRLALLQLLIICVEHRSRSGSDKEHRDVERSQEKELEAQRPHVDDGRRHRAYHEPDRLSSRSEDEQRWVDCLRSGVGDQPGQHGETLSLLKTKKLAGHGGRRL